ncbi:amidohydrolase [Thiocapsa marina]|uniref:Amidohydrolase 3 n=1 Tax=Thiocapsa marina 5811 TaxID=768671 RepID=F9UGW6_9GAMM|nr:amidohydrolase [Thiocapsa marina]EGV16586.1 Amidohydrolase 3 [Thiocapsa marina 5811]
MFRFTMAAALLLASASAFAQTADRIWSGGPILTMNDAAMRAEAIAERDGRIIAVGSSEEVMPLRGPDTRLIDLNGRALLPGFVDAHGHMMMGGLQALSANLLAPPDGDVTSIASLQQVLRDWVAANQAAVDKAKLIIGFGYDNAQLAELRHPTRDDLDAVSDDYPILIIHQSGHLAVLNSKALEIAGISAASKDPEGGVIRRRADSEEPNGVLEELAMFSALFKILPAIGAEGFKEFARAGSNLWARFGYTTAQEGRSSPDTVRLMREVAAEGSFAIDVVTYPDVLIDRDFIKAGVSPGYDQRLRIAGAKLTIDGSPQGFTAWRDQPYYKPMGNYPPGYSGYAAATAEQVFDAALWAAENAIQLITHANGERAMDLLIAAQRAAAARHPEAGALRPALIHGQFVRADQLDDFKALGVIPSLFPMHTFYWGDWHLEHTVGPEKGQNISPTGWVLERDMIFTSHHDAPVAFPDSMRVLDATVTRRARGSGVVVGPQHRVDVITALKAMTLWPAYQHFEETTKGSLEVGKLADFVILSADPTAVDPETLDTLAVTETVKEGRTVFRLDARTARAAENPGFTRAMAALAGASHAPRMIQPSAWSQVLAGQKAAVTTACLSDLFLALSDGMASAPGR